jgi:transcriptional regulator with XRE-family HTH domain
MKVFSPEFLRDLRSQKKMSLTQAAEATKGGVCRQSIWLWESGKQAPSSSRLAILADTLGVPMDSFFVESDYHSNNTTEPNSKSA